MVQINDKISPLTFIDEYLNHGNNYVAYEVSKDLGRFYNLDTKNFGRFQFQTEICSD